MAAAAAIFAARISLSRSVICRPQASALREIRDVNAVVVFLLVVPLP